MVWLDNAGVSGVGRTLAAAELADHVWAMPAEKRPLIFAGVAFKYQPHEPAPGSAARFALHMGFIPTTSGDGTGMAPSIEKIQAMSAATEGTLAVASGMDVENVRTFAPHLSHILVASGVSLDTYHFDPVRLAEFVCLAKSVPASPGA